MQSAQAASQHTGFGRIEPLESEESTSLMWYSLSCCSKKHKEGPTMASQKSMKTYNIKIKHMMSTFQCREEAQERKLGT